ncbi:MAG: E2/UBC family protein [bacterium]
MPPQDLIRDLQARGLKVRPEPSMLPGGPYVIIDDYEVPVGQHHGKKITLAIPTPGDFPITPPGGIHIIPHLIQVGTRNVHQSPMGAEWQYWSRPIVDWRHDRSTARLMSHVNRLMLDA